MASSAAEAPKPPEDPELRNIIDKLAQFVARNGSEFENMTKEKQKDNPRFSFLFGGENYQYYIYKVNAEQAIQRKQKMQGGDQSTSAQIQIMQHQLQESEKNLRLQFDALMVQQQEQIDEGILVAEREQIKKLADDHDMKLDDFGSILLLIQTSCSKDSISTNKKWFLNKCQSAVHAEILLKYLINKVKEKTATFMFKLHVLYLVNDLIHHYMQKHMAAMLDLLGAYVSIMFSCVYAGHAKEESQKEKLEKLRSIWQSQQYFSTDVLGKLLNVDQTYQDYRQIMGQNYPSIVAEVMQKIQAQYRQYETQHQQYSQHVKQQITTLENKMATQTSMNQPPPFQPSMPPQYQQQLPPGAMMGQSPQRRSRFDKGPPLANAAYSGGPMFAGSGGPNMPPAVSQGQHQPPYPYPDSGMQGPPPQYGGGGGTMPSRQPLLQQWPGQQDFGPPGASQPPYGGYAPPQPSSTSSAPPPPQQPPPAPLMSINARPPPPPASSAFPRQPPPPQLMDVNTAAVAWPPPPAPSAPAITPQRPLYRPTQPSAAVVPRSPLLDDPLLVPKVPYYDLPAALMVPLVQLSDNDYKPLDPSKIRLPPPMAPSERLIAAVDAFYAPPSHENPRDSDGWEKLGLYEFFKAKQAAVKAKHREAAGIKSDEPDDDAENRRRRRSGSYSSTDSRDSATSRGRSRSLSRSPERKESD